MLHYVCHNLFESPAQTLVNTVNTVGVMGKGIAEEFKRRYPDMFERYREHCKSGALTIGKLYLFRTPNKWVLNFPTKEHWKAPSKLEWIETGLEKFVVEYETRGISSISFPQLGCGNGGLDWAQVKPLMDHYLRPLPIPIFIHMRINDPNFVPEHQHSEQPSRVDPTTISAPPERISFYQFLTDFMALFGSGTPPAPEDLLHSHEPPQLPEIEVSGEGFVLHVSGESLQKIWDQLTSVGAIRMRELPSLSPDDSMLLAQQLSRLRYIGPMTFVEGTFSDPQAEPGIRYSPSPEPSLGSFARRAVELRPD
jgi:O-acetyl-ADP-ribose deacetylase (regulator of RNase III)